MQTILIYVDKINRDEVSTEEVIPSMHQKIITGEKLMIAKMKFKDGFLVQLHHHVHEEVTSNIRTDGFWFGENKNQILDLYAGDVIVIPSNLPHDALMIGEV